MEDKTLWLRCGDNGYVVAATQREPALISHKDSHWTTPDGDVRKASRDLDEARRYASSGKVLEMLTEVGAPFRCQARMGVALFADRTDLVMKVESLVGRFEINHYLDTGLAAVVRRTVHGGAEHADLAYLLGTTPPLPSGGAEDFAEVLPLLHAAVTAAVGGTDR